MSKLNLPEGASVTILRSNHTVAATEYSKALRRASKLDAVDKTEFWSSLAAKYPSYQILPDTNNISYVKNNILASIYSVGKSASLIPTSEEDKDIVANLNIILDSLWSQLGVSMYQMRAGERAALMNLGVTQVGWDNNIVNTHGSFYKGQVRLKNINPLHYMRDPYADSLDTAGYVITWDKYHKAVLESHPGYGEAFKEFLATQKFSTDTSSTVPQGTSDRLSAENATQTNYYTVYSHWIRVGKNIHEIHLLNNEYPLLVKENIKPNMFPFAELYCNLPSGGSLFGVSEPAKIFANALAYNIMNSIVLTAEYKNQRPPRFVNKQAGLNIAAFVRTGNDADRTFIVDGDASKAVHYHQFPQPSAQATTSMMMLQADMKNISGVDDKYTGRDTGSITTTGGVENMLAQVTMIDAPKIMLYENYSKRLTNLIIANLIQLSSIERSYLVKNKDGKSYRSVDIDFPSIPDDAVFEYEMAITSELPKNKAVIQNMANKMMEMQMQYTSQGIEVDLITPQEWLMCQDLPMREYMLERMNIQRSANWLTDVAQIVSQYGNMVEQGVDPEEAMHMTAATMQAQNTPGGGMQDVMNELQQGGNPVLTNGR